MVLFLGQCKVLFLAQCRVLFLGQCRVLFLAQCKVLFLGQCKVLFLDQCKVQFLAKHCLLLSLDIVVDLLLLTAQISQLQQSPNGQTRVHNMQVLQTNKQRMEGKLRPMAQNLLDQRLVSRSVTSTLVFSMTSTGLELLVLSCNCPCDVGRR